jgi:hypothetical protein
MLSYLYITGPETFIYEAALMGLDADLIKSRIQWALASMFIMMILGSAFAPYVIPRAWRFPLPNSSQAEAAGPSCVYHLSRLKRSCLWLLVIGTAGVIIWEDQIGKIINYFTSEETEFHKTLIRRADGGTGIYIYNVYLSALAPLVVMALWCMSRKRPNDLELKALFAALFLLVLVGKFGLLSKSPPVLFLLQFLLLRHLVIRGRLSWRVAAGFLGLAAALIFLFVRVTITNIESADIPRFLYYRIFEIPNEAILEYFAAFPQRIIHGWEYGVFGNFARAPGELVVPNYFLVGEVTRGSLISSSNAMFIADAWADYAWLGVIAFSFLAGFITRCIDLFSLRHGRSDEWVCITCACASGVFTMLTTALPTSTITGGLLLTPLASIFLFGDRRMELRSRDRIT